MVQGQCCVMFPGTCNDISHHLGRTRLYDFAAVPKISK